MYKEIDDVFDAVTYQKGSCILNMLRNYIGKDAFLQGLNIYLKNNAFRNAESTQLRIAFEEASGLDLNWFFNQWYFGAGHPELNISYNWDSTTKTQSIYLKQVQEGNTFILPMAIDFYIGNKVQRHNIRMAVKLDTLTYNFPAKPNLVNVDADKVLITKKDDRKTLSELAFQYFNAPLFLDRFEAVEAALKSQDEKDAQRILLASLEDRYYGIRMKTINELNINNGAITRTAIPLLRKLVASDENNLVKAAAITLLGKFKQTENFSLFKQSLKRESYAVQGAALDAIALVNPSAALNLAKQFESDDNLQIRKRLVTLYAAYGGNKQWSYINHLFLSLTPEQRWAMKENFANLVGRVENPAFAIQGITALKELGILAKQYRVAHLVIDLLKEVKRQRINLHDKTSSLLIDEALKQIDKAK